MERREVVVDAAHGADAASDVGDPSRPDPDAPARDELAYRLRQQELMTEFGVCALRATGRAELLDHAVRLAARGLDVDLCKYLERREAEGDLLVVAGIGWDEGTVGRDTLSCDDGSPAGYAWLMDRAVLSNHLSDEHRFRTPDLLRRHGVRRAINVPVKDGGKPYGVLEADSRQDGDFGLADISFLQGMANVLSVAISRQRKIEELDRARERLELLAGEMRHRVKNTFAVVNALVAMSRREVRERGGDVIDALSGRIEALRVAGAAALEGEKGTDVAAEGGGWVDPVPLSARVLGAFGHGVRVLGDARPLPSGQAGPVSLILHELATNAVKYGALSREGGGVELCWSVRGASSALEWRERGGPRLSPDAIRPGFGTRLIDGMAIAAGADLRREFHAEGLHLTLVLEPPERPGAS
ncbi:MAG: sensor histidine kinase [Hasllibacter sp.]